MLVWAGEKVGFKPRGAYPEHTLMIYGYDACEPAMNFASKLGARGGFRAYPLGNPFIRHQGKIICGASVQRTLAFVNDKITTKCVF